MWQRLNRKTLVTTPHIRVYEDTIKLPGGSIIDDYTVVNLNTPVLVVATDVDGNLLVQYEYRYAHNETMLSLPAGMIDEGESPEEAAKRELLEETGYTADILSYIGELYEYPTKLDHTVHIVRADGIKKTNEPDLEETETIEGVRFVTLDELKALLEGHKIKSAAIVAALYMALPGLKS